MISGISRLVRSLAYANLSVLLIQESHRTKTIIALCESVGTPKQYTVMSGTATGAHSVCANVRLAEARISYSLLSEEMLVTTK